MNIVGTWILNWDWSCTGTYAQTQMTFAGDQTFNIPDFSETGIWAQNEGEIIFRFDGTPATVYSGDGVNDVMVGTSADFTGGNGCWYALQSGSSTMAVAARAPAQTPAGKKV